MPKKEKLPENITIADLLGQTAGRKLRNPFKYVAGVYGSLLQHGWQTPGLRVRIGREGTGAQPYYRIEKDDDNGSEKILGFYHGEGHSRFDDTFNIQNRPTWSKKTTSYIEIQKLHDTLKTPLLASATGMGIKKP